MKKIDYRRILLGILKLRMLLLILTVIELAYLMVYILKPELWNILFNYHMNLTIGLLHFFVAATFIWFNWQILPISRKKKIDNTLLILFLGILGMWLWIPNKRNFRKFLKEL